MRTRIGKAKGGGVRHLDPDDRRNLDHPCHDEQFLELARAIGREMARQQYARDHETKSEDSGPPRPILKRPPEGSLD
jgi:hypothetical protein